VSDVRVDRVHIRVAGVTPELGAELARLVADRLAPPLALAPGEAAVERLRATVAGRPGEDAASLAGRIAAQVALLVGRSGVPEAGR
jgi:hypothetical protein